MSQSGEPEPNQLIEKLTELGGRASNAELRNKLGWDKDTYFNVRNGCKAAGLVGLGRGRGGFVFLTESTKLGGESPEATKEELKSEEEEYAREAEYYQKLYPTIVRDWIESEGFDDYVVEITASKRARGLGRWTVPDIVVIGKIVRQYVPGLEFTVQSIEVKRFEAADALSVFEALSHRRASHFSYLLLVNCPKKPSERDSERIAQISQLCEEHQVGLIIVEKGDEGNYDNWEFEVVVSEKMEPNPYTLDGFIKQYVSAQGRESVAKMVR